MASTPQALIAKERRAQASCPSAPPLNVQGIHRPSSIGHRSSVIDHARGPRGQPMPHPCPLSAPCPSSPPRPDPGPALPCPIRNGLCQARHCFLLACARPWSVDTLNTSIRPRNPSRTTWSELGKLGIFAVFLVIAGVGACSYLDAKQMAPFIEHPRRRQPCLLWLPEPTPALSGYARPTSA